ncbi:MAG: Uma2 family endonuclease [Chloroflexi bacterium]|nr:Uma2 family endonuclease [Chloroflexota bacterium]
MSEITLKIPAHLPAGLVVATDVSEQDYLTSYAEHFHEWIDGVVIKLTPVSDRHEQVSVHFRVLLNMYFELRPIGKARLSPFVMCIRSAIREPDVQVILNDNPGDFSDMGMIGPADICIEIVSPESIARDRGEKFSEYEQARVKEYWIIDPVRQSADFYRLLDANRYAEIMPDAEGNYRTPLLHDLRINIATLWRKSLPGYLEIAEQVKEMLGN